ncbi:tRNA (adenosine(37)-N6)-threonylcarbamoyltransferase complex transferase subunit TsaD [Candidatus Sumerlaeota bacterium]|nr:tRNA (adenosine(37)-N6)-threonylcarbamoyltransferase complex transferase subunit TsaD [Candidatus Sumerlaeota bacterium]
MRILGIETSCDETAAAVVEDGRSVLSNVIASQIRVHSRYRGVVPEIASRCHIEFILPVVAQALEGAGLGEEGEGIDAVAVTRGPGLVGALLVGVETAKTLAWRWQKPLIPVHHSLGHLYSPFCELVAGQSRVLDIAPEDAGEGTPEWRGELRPAAPSESSADPAPGPRRHASRATRRSFGYPYLGLVISGGHSSLVRLDGPGKVRTLGSTLDDAPGEAYDKVAKCLNLPYPGGPEIDSRAARGNPTAFDLPRPVLHARGYDFSFSGLKTAVIRLIEVLGGTERVLGDELLVCDLCASFQAAVIDVLLHKAERALRDEGLERLAIVGGVACNKGLRAQAARRMSRTHLVFPPPILCTDNAAMIAAVAHHIEPLSPDEAMRLDARAGWRLD